MEKGSNISLTVSMGPRSAAETEAQTEPHTEPQTEPPAPVAADVIDVSQIQTLLASGSTATSAEVYIYDLKHDSEVAVNDCTVQLRLSAMITVPILYTAASRIDAGELSMDTEITYVTTIGGRGEITTEVREGQVYPLSFYLQTMVNYSDNNCINVLIDYIGLDQIKCGVNGIALTVQCIYVHISSGLQRRTATYKLLAQPIIAPGYVHLLKYGWLHKNRHKTPYD